MNAHDAVKSLTLTRNPKQPGLLDYAAEMSFMVSFGKMNFTITGSLDAEIDPPQSVIYDTVLNAAIEDLKKTPKLFEPVSRYLAWETAGKPPYAPWCMANYPITQH